MDDYRPDPEPSGALTPPPRYPPTAPATSAPLPPRRLAERPLFARGGFAGVLNAALDGLDTLGDRIAGVLGLR
jgi:hypothetical protein